MRNLLLWNKTLGPEGRYWVRQCICYRGDAQNGDKPSNITLGEQIKGVVEVVEV